jgi:MFS family permease
MMIVAILSGPVGGYFSDRLRSRKVMIVVPFVLLALLFLFPFSVTGWAIPAIMVVSGIVAGPIAPVSLAAVPEIMVSPQLAGIGLGVAALGQNVGMFIGPALFGRLLETVSWTAAGYLMIPVCAVAVIAGCLAKIR